MNTRVVERQKEFMKTTITIKVVQTKESTVKINEAIEQAYGEFDRIVEKFTRFDENSELSNLNRMAGEWVTVSEEFIYLIEKMLEYSKISNGLFDPTIIDFLEIYGYDKNYDFSKLDNPKLNEIVQKRIAERPSWKEIEIDKKNSKVKLAKNQKIDLGSIGKGYAVDCAVEKLIKVSKNFILDAGGDVYAIGKNEKGETWQVGLKTIDEVVGQIELDGECVASSGNWARKFKQFHHLINPTNGEPIETDYSTVFVKAKTATDADGWATTFFIGGRELAKTIDEDLEVLFN